MKKTATKQGRWAPREWVGGLVGLPAIDDFDAPAALFWMSDEGHVICHELGRAETLLACACSSLAQTLAEAGEAAPARVRVASPALAAALSKGQVAIQVVCAQTPELDHFAATLLTAFDDGRESRMGEAPGNASVREAGDGAEVSTNALQETYLSVGVDAAAVASLFRAAAALFRAKPWAIIPAEHSVIAASIEAFGIRDAAVAIIGQMRENFGLLVFSSRGDVHRFRRFADGNPGAELPGHHALFFERGAEVAPKLRKEIARHVWEVAGADAYPSLVAVTDACQLQPPTAHAVVVAEAIALALVAVLGDQEAALSAWRGDSVLARTVRVVTHQGELDVALRIPVDSVLDGDGELLEALAAAASDSEARRALEGELLMRFAAAPEARTVSRGAYNLLMMDLAVEHLGATIATLSAPGLATLLFEIFPQKVVVAPSAARGIVADARALYAFLKREFALPQADACLAVLGRGAMTKLASCLRDRTKFGFGKALLLP